MSYSVMNSPSAASGSVLSMSASRSNRALISAGMEHIVEWTSEVDSAFTGVSFYSTLATRYSFVRRYSPIASASSPLS